MGQTSTVYELSGGTYFLVILGNDGVLVVTLMSRLMLNVILAVPIISGILLYGLIGGIVAAVAAIAVVWYLVRRQRKRVKSFAVEDLPKQGHLGYSTQEVPWEAVHGADVTGRLLTIRLGTQGRRQITLRVPEADIDSLTSLLARKLGDRLIVRQ